jgi:hypothetical protein
MTVKRETCGDTADFMEQVRRYVISKYAFSADGATKREIDTNVTNGGNDALHDASA